MVDLGLKKFNKTALVPGNEKKQFKVLINAWQSSFPLFRADPAD